MSQWTIFHRIGMSFYSKKLYQAVIQNFTGTGFGYLFLLLAICWVPHAWRFNIVSDDYIQNIILPFVKELPNIEIHQGKVSIDKPNPFYIKNPENGEIFGIIDTSGNTQTFEKTATKFIITQDHVLINHKHSSISSYHLGSIENFKFGEKEIEHFFVNIQSKSAFFLYPFCVLGAFFYRMFQALLYGALAVYFAHKMRTTSDFPAMLRLSTLAVTPAILLGTAEATLDLVIPFSGTLYFLLTMFYILWGLQSTRSGGGMSGGGFD